MSRYTSSTRPYAGHLLHGAGAMATDDRPLGLTSSGEDRERLDFWHPAISWPSESTAEGVVQQVSKFSTAGLYALPRRVLDVGLDIIGNGHASPFAGRQQQQLDHHTARMIDRATPSATSRHLTAFWHPVLPEIEVYPAESEAAYYGATVRFCRRSVALRGGPEVMAGSFVGPFPTEPLIGTPEAEKLAAEVLR